MIMEQAAGRRRVKLIKPTVRRHLSPAAEYHNADVWRARIGMSVVAAVFVASAAIVLHLIPA